MLDVEASTESHDAISALVARFDPDVIHLPGGSARIRLEAGDETWDVLASEEGAELAAGELRVGANSILSADAATWKRLVTDVRGGMKAFRRGRLKVRRNLHLGV